jgi:hypothetical protein
MCIGRIFSWFRDTAELFSEFESTMKTVKAVSFRAMVSKASALRRQQVRRENLHLQDKEQWEQRDIDDWVSDIERKLPAVWHHFVQYALEKRLFSEPLLGQYLNRDSGEFGFAERDEIILEFKRATSKLLHVRLSDF